MGTSISCQEGSDLRADRVQGILVRPVTGPLWGRGSGSRLGPAVTAFSFRGCSTSAAVDAYPSGLPVVVMLDDTELNLSPLRGHPEVHFVSTPDELARAFQVVKETAVPSLSRKDLNFLDTELLRWRMILGLRP